MKKFFANNKVTLLDITGMFLLIILFFFYNLFSFNAGSGSMKPIGASVGYMTVPGKQDAYTIIDNGKGRVLGVNDGKVTYQILVGGDEQTFYQAENICVDPTDNSVYIQSVDWDESGYLLGSERVLHFDSKGKYISTPYIRKYVPEDEVNQHRVFDPKIIDGKLYVVYADDIGVSQYRVDADGVVQTAFFEYDDAWIYFQNYCQIADGEIYGVDKTGHIQYFHDGSYRTVYDFDKSSKEVIFFVDVDADGEIYYTDIYNGRVCRVISQSESEVVSDVRDFYPEGTFTPGSDQMITVRTYLAENGIHIGFMLNNRVIIMDHEGNILTDVTEISLGDHFIIRGMVYNCILFLGAIIIIYFLLRVLFIVIVVRPQVKPIWKVEIGFAVFAVLMTFAILSNMSSLFGSNYMESLAQRLTDIAISGSNIINHNWIKGVDDMSDFMNEDYTKIANAMHLMTTSEHEYDRRYGAEIEVLGDDGRAYCLAYTDNSIGVYYPMDESAKLELENIYQNKHSVYNLSQVAAGGTFIYGRAPIFDEEGNVTAVLSMALDSYKERARLMSMVTSVIINVLLMVIIIMFLINEGFAMVGESNTYISGKGATIMGRKIPMHALRIAAFGVSFVLNMTSSFLSVYTSGFWTEKLGISQSLAGAIPLFANGAFTALSALFCPTLLGSIGFLGVTAIGVACSGLGDLLAGLSNSYISIVLALLLNGLGFGILINVISITVGRIDDEDDRKNGYAQFNAGCISGINCGMIAGSMLVSIVRYNQVFFVTSALWISLIGIFIYLNKHIMPVKKQENTERRSTGKISLQAVVYAMFITFPYAIAGSFMYFYLPIFINSMGYSEEYVSILMMIYAVCGIFLGKALTNIMWKMLNRWSVFAAILMAMAAWMIIVCFPTLNMVAMAMLLIGISFSFGLNVAMNAYLEGKDVAVMRQEDAVGIYEFSSRAGQCLSSIICGLMMGAGIVYGMGIFSIISVVLFLMYILIYRDK